MNDAATVAGSREIVVDEVFPHTPEVVWRAITLPGMMSRWLKMEPVGFAPTVGTRFTYRTTPAGAWDGVIHCEVLEATAPERLVYSWKGGHDGNVGYGSRLDTVVTFIISAVEKGARLRLIHAGFVFPTNESAFKNMSEGWVKVVRTIETIAAEQD
ncbi:SRPBCC domain-containing protein [Phenylobacterium sp.]|uniref:SRPBCC family protein n=1 Tax=Phenylobacterium sp. TaxID=1871053 RepID=UPI00286CAC58|nr:SRPBCC domain-containing protein [Phenylobacterium sp.]